MTKYLEPTVQITLNVLEMVVASTASGAILWFFGLVGIAPRLEYWTSVYVAQFGFTFVSVAYEMVRHCAEDGATAR